MANSNQTPISENVKSGVSKRSSFPLDYESIFTCDFGDLVPVVMKEMVPGDTFNCNLSAFSRLSPLATPTFGRIKGNVNYFFVPSRILMGQDEFEKSITGGSDGSYPARFPFITPAGIRTILQDASEQQNETELGVAITLRSMRKLFSYLGLPDPLLTIATTSNAEADSISLLPFAAYARIYSDYYYPVGLELDEQLELLYQRKWTGLYTSEVLEGQESEDVVSRIALMYMMQCYKTCYTKDYFTTAFIRPQRGDEVFAGVNTASVGLSDNIVRNPSSQGAGGVSNSALSTLTMKWATAIQRFLERNNIAGGRYFEQMLARFGVKIAASRLDRSEYLGGTDFYVSVSDVTSTAATDDANLGDMAGKGIGLGKQGASYTATEHGFFVALLHYVPETGYPQALDRMWTRHSKFDYFTPELEDTGMQPVYNREIYGNAQFSPQVSNLPPSGVFGYVPRYAEYKFSKPVLGGDFLLRPDVSESAVENEAYNNMLDSFHLFRTFEDVPVLGFPFVTIDSKNGGFDRIFQDTNTDFDHFFVNVQVSLQASRPMLGYAEAGLSFTHEEKGSEIRVPYGGMRL